MEKQPRFSLIIGMYNHLKYLPKLMESLENQTFQDFEIHFCDDGSNDGTREWFNALEKNERWQYHRQRNRGMRLSKNLNQGIKKAKGEYCVFIMGDSFPEINYLEILNEYVAPDKVLCGIRVHIEGKRLIEMDYRLRKNLIPQEVVMLPNMPYHLITGNGLCVPTEALKKYGGWNEKFKGYGGDDNELAARLYYKGKYIFYSIPQAILYHHYHRSSTSNEKTSGLLKKLITQYAK